MSGSESSINQHPSKTSRALQTMSILSNTFIFWNDISSIRETQLFCVEAQVLSNCMWQVSLTLDAVTKLQQGRMDRYSLQMIELKMITIFCRLWGGMGEVWRQLLSWGKSWEQVQTPLIHLSIFFIQLFCLYISFIYFIHLFTITRQVFKSRLHLWNVYCQNLEGLHSKSKEIVQP